MTPDEIIQYCLSKPYAFLCYPFGPDVSIIKVGAEAGPARIFAQVFRLRGADKATFSCSAVMGEVYRNIYPDAVVRGYHCPPVQQPYFNTVSLDSTVPNDVLLEMIDHAYFAVVGKLPKKVQKELEASHEA